MISREVEGETLTGKDLNVSLVSSRLKDSG